MKENKQSNRISYDWGDFLVPVENKNLTKIMSLWKKQKATREKLDAVVEEVDDLLSLNGVEGESNYYGRDKSAIQEYENELRETLVEKGAKA